MFQGIDHIDIVVEDTERMAAFLVSLGFKVLRRTEGGRGTIELQVPGPGDQPFIELTPSLKADGSRIPLGLRHVALRAPNLEAVVAKLQADGFAFKGGIRKVPNTGRTVANLQDPEGKPLQLAGD